MSNMMYRSKDKNLSQPLIGANLTQRMFKQNEKLNVPKPNNMFSDAYKNLSSLSDLNSYPELANNMKDQMPAFLSQAKMSTFYQDNPWETLTSSKKYGVETLGGEIDPNQSPGHRPGNTYRNN
jgi:hypothetical protein